MANPNPSLAVVLLCDNHNYLNLHQCILMLFDSPLNHAGHLQVYIQIDHNQIIKLHRELRIPRTFKRFKHLFEDFLSGHDVPLVETKDGPRRLLQFVTKLDAKTETFHIRNLTPRLRSPNFFTESAKPATIFIDCGPVDFNNLDVVKTKDANTYSISNYPLSASLTCVKLTSAYEKSLGIF